VSGQQHASVAIYPRERPGAHCTGGWVRPRAGLDGRKISSPLGFDPGPSSRYSVAVPTELPTRQVLCLSLLREYIIEHKSCILTIYIYIYIYICVCVCVCVCVYDSNMVNLISSKYYETPSHFHTEQYEYTSVLRITMTLSLATSEQHAINYRSYSTACRDCGFKSRQGPWPALGRSATGGRESVT